MQISLDVKRHCDLLQVHIPRTSHTFSSSWCKQTSRLRKSFYPPEAEIIAADFVLRTMGVLVFDLWTIVAGHEPRIIFHDDNQAMIAVIRSGKNPTMRHIERSHGSSIAWMHEIFLLSYIILIYEITSKMAADIHTKAFRGPMAWKRACLLINVLDDKDISGDEVCIMQPTHDANSRQRQKIVQSTGNVPTFQVQYTPTLQSFRWKFILRVRQGR